MTWCSRVPSVVRRVLGAFLGLLGVYLLLLPLAVRSLRYEVILSGSMAPGLPVGSLIVVRELPASQYQVGDVVSFKVPSRPSEVVTHRLVRLYRDEQGLRLAKTKGDANTNGDPWTLSLGNIMGKEVAVIPWLGYLAIVMRLPSGFLAAAALSLVFLVLPEMWALWSEPVAQNAAGTPGTEV
ncbi:MAG: signal peptidase I [bacterium]